MTPYFEHLQAGPHPSPEAVKEKSIANRTTLNEQVSPEKTHALHVLDKWEEAGIFSCPLKQQGRVIEQMIMVSNDYGINLAELSPEEASMIIEDLNFCVVNEKKDTIKNEALTADTIIDALIASGATSINEYETALNNLLASGDVSEEIYTIYSEKIEGIKAQLKSVSEVFTEEEQMQIFGGSLEEKVSIDFGGSSTAEIFADVYTSIESSDLSEEEKRGFQEKVSEKLGIPIKNQLAKGAGQLKSQLYIRQQQAENGEYTEDGEPIHFDSESRLLVQVNPLIEVYPNPTNETDFICEGRADNADPLYISFNKDTPNTVLNAAMNQQMVRTMISNHGGSGVMAAYLETGTTLGGTIEQNTETAALGNNQLMETMIEAELGINTALYSRFLDQEELSEIADNQRFKVPQGDLGAFNVIDPTTQNKFIEGLGFSRTPEGQTAMLRAGDLYRGRKGIEKSYESLYRMMYPEDVKNDFPRLKKILGEELFLRLNF